MAEEPGASRTTALEARGATGPSSEVERVRMEIERTRQELGDTVAALAGKTDVKARTKDKLADVRESLRDALPRGEGGDEAGEPGVAARLRATAEEHRTAAAALAALAGGILLGRLARRRPPS